MAADSHGKRRIANRRGALLGLTVLLLSSAPGRAQEKQAPPGAPPARKAEQPAPGKLKFPQDVAANEIAGVVVDAQGKPLADVLVDAWTWYPGDETRTDQNGAFRLKTWTNQAQYVELRISKPGYSPYYNPQQPRGRKDLLVTLGQKTYLDGIVRNPQGAPVADALVVGDAGPKQGDGVLITHVTTSTKTDEKGHYRLYLAPDIYQIEVAVKGAGSRRLTGVRLAQDESKNLDIDLRPGVRFEANVVDANTRQPVPRFVLFNWQDKNVRGVSDENGKIVIEDMLPGKYEFNVGHGEPKKLRGMLYYEHGELGRWWSPQAVNEWQRKSIEPSGWQRNFDGLSFDLSVGMKPVTIEVERGVVFSGHVYDPDGNPVFRATVAPARTGTGNSLTGDTRYSVTTASDGSYRVVMPAGNNSDYNLVAHDGSYNHWRKWANAVSEPLKTKPGEHYENFDLKLIRGATVRGRVVTDNDRVVGNREVRAHAADLRENRYYDPTVKVREDGTFELKFVRPGKQYIQVSPFWLSAADARGSSSVVIDLKPGEVREGIELHVAQWAQPVVASLGARMFRVKLLDRGGKPAANQSLAILKGAPESQILTALVGTPSGLAKRLATLTGGIRLKTDAQGLVAIPGTKLFDQRASAATVVAIDADREVGAIGCLFADLRSPEITLRLSAFCDTTASIARDKLPDAESPDNLRLEAGGIFLLSTALAKDHLDLQLPVGNYAATVGNMNATPKTVKFSVKPGQERLDLGVIELLPSRLASLIGKRAPELRSIAEWGNGPAVTLASLRGKVVILDFWGSWCGPCLASMPNLMKIYDAYPPEDVVIIAVHDGTLKSLEEMRHRTESAKKETWKGRELPFHIALAGGGATKIEGTDDTANCQAVADYGIIGFPTTLLIDRDGVVVTRLDAWDLDGAKKRIGELLRK
jgi:thiol-disulfide isomerase/thioredoxin